MDLNRLVVKAAERCARHPYAVLAFALLLTILSGWTITDLPVYTSRQALLPKDTAVVQRLDAFLSKFGAASDLIVVMEGGSRESREAFAAELTSRLTPEPEIGEVNARLDSGFFLRHAYLLLPPEWLDRAAALTAAEDRKQPPDLGWLLRHAADWLEHPPAATSWDLGLAAEGIRTAAWLVEEWGRWLAAERVPEELEWGPLLAQYGAAELARGDYTSRDGGMLFVFVHPKNPAEDFDVRGPFIDKVKSVTAAIGRDMAAAGQDPPHVGLAGLPAAEYEEYIDIQHDIILVIVTAVVLIGLLILIVVRSVRWAIAIFVPMAIGALWSQALVFYTVGHLTLITSGFIAILFGLGADYGIFTSSRIAEERQAGRPLLEAIGAGIGASFLAVLTAGGASLVIFGALATVEFPGFAELGVVASEGVLLILLSTWLVQPALYALLPPQLASRNRQPLAAPARPVLKRGGYPFPVAVTLVVAAMACAVVGVVHGLALPFNYDALALLPKDSEAAHYQRRMAVESDYQSEVVIFTAGDMAEARRITTEAGRLDSVGKVQSLTQLFPDDAEARSDRARRLAVVVGGAGYAPGVTALDRAGLPPKAFDRLRTLLQTSQQRIDEAQEQAFSAGHAELVKELERLRSGVARIRTELDSDPLRGRERSEALFRGLLRVSLKGLTLVEGWREAEPLTPEQIPAGLRSRFFAPDGTIAIYAFPAKSVYDPIQLEHLMTQVYRVSPAATGFPATSWAFSQAAVRSFTEGTQLALIVCLTWLLLVLRSIKGFVLASLPLLIGGGWMLGVMALGGISYNYANIIALPLVIALAVDYGVWYSHRWRELDRQSPFQVTVTAGKVIALAAGTELAGLGAITLASYRGISTMGANITIGLLCCLAATLFVAPAIGQLMDPRRMR